MRANARQGASAPSSGATVVRLWSLPPEPYVAVVRRLLVKESIETADALGLPFVRTSAVVEALVAHGWLAPEAREHAALLERRLTEASHTATVEEARGLEVMTDSVIGWLRMGANRAAEYARRPPVVRS
jgi:hypothetical protein